MPVLIWSTRCHQLCPAYSLLPEDWRPPSDLRSYPNLVRANHKRICMCAARGEWMRRLRARCWCTHLARRSLGTLPMRSCAQESRPLWTRHWPACRSWRSQMHRLLEELIWTLSKQLLTVVSLWIAWCSIGSKEVWACQRLALDFSWLCYP